MFQNSFLIKFTKLSVTVTYLHSLRFCLLDQQELHMLLINLANAQPSAWWYNMYPPVFTYLFFYLFSAHISPWNYLTCLLKIYQHLNGVCLLFNFLIPKDRDPRMSCGPQVRDLVEDCFCFTINDIFFLNFELKLLVSANSTEDRVFFLSSSFQFALWRAENNPYPAIFMQTYIVCLFTSKFY